MGGGVVEIRTFLNSDVPQLVELWNRQQPLSGRLPAVSAAMLETHVFSKAYFDPTGLIFATASGLVVGAVLCGFAPRPTLSQLDFRIGIVSHAIVDQAAPVPTWPQLWAATLDYYRAHQSETLFWGSRFPESPFLSGFCGGTFVPGAAASDANQTSRLLQYGFGDCGEIGVLKLEVESFKPPIDRRVVMAKRSYDVRLTLDPLPESWWQHNVFAFRHQLDFRMVERKSNRICGLVSFCNSRPQDAGWDSRFLGIAQIVVNNELQRSGLGQAMLFDAIKDLGQRGVVEIEAQVPRPNAACHSMLTKIGFRPWYAARQLSCPIAK